MVRRALECTRLNVVTARSCVFYNWFADHTMTVTSPQMTHSGTYWRIHKLALAIVGARASTGWCAHASLRMEFVCPQIDEPVFAG